jgi:uridine kinase
MIDQAVQDFNIARERSWLIGDSSVDIEAARRAGLKSILVETGYAGLDFRTWAIPDATVPTLGDAVSFVLDCYPRLFSYCSKLAEDIRAGTVVLIGGQSRSGKSTFANVLRDAIQARGQVAVVLSLDRWLKNEKQRTAGVLGRYDMDVLQALVRALGDAACRPDTLALPGYHKLTRETVAGVDTIPLRASDVVLLEGTVALALGAQDSTDTYRIHIDIEEASRKQRVVSEYRLRGFGEPEALDVYLARRKDEYPVIDKLASSAHRVMLTSI